MKKKFLICLIIFSLLCLLSSCSRNEELIIHIGYQSQTAQTWGAIIMKNKKLFETKLLEEYPNMNIQLSWHDEVSGAVINTSMISGKYQFGFMGDMPILLNMYKSQNEQNYNAVLIAFDGKGENGRNQAILVPKGSDVKSVTDLAGKTVSVPIGSSAHRMLQIVLEKYGVEDHVEVVHNDVSIAASLLQSQKIDAFSVWSPFPNYFNSMEYSEILVDGTESETDYLNGVMANKDWIIKHHDIAVLFVQSLIESHQFIINYPDEAAKIIAEDSGFPEDIVLKELSQIRWDCGIYEKDIQTLYDGMNYLNSIGELETFNFLDMISFDYIAYSAEALHMPTYQHSMMDWPDYQY